MPRPAASYLYPHLSSAHPLIPLSFQETIGSYTSSPMQEAGASEKSSAIDEMRAAKAASDSQTGGEVNKNSTIRKMEKTLGDATGCEGMSEEGGKRIP